MLCYDISEPRSLEDVKRRWRREVGVHFCRGEDRLPVLLVGFKRDLRCGREREGGKGVGVVDPMEVCLSFFPLTYSGAWGGLFFLFWVGGVVG